MKKNLRLTFLKGDILAIVLVAAIAVGVLAAYAPRGRGGEESVVQVWQDGRLVREVPLDKDTRMDVAGEYLNVVVVEDGRACIAESDCPGADCVHSGWISGSGRSVVCLPNRVEVRVTGVSEVDLAVG